MADSEPGARPAGEASRWEWVAGGVSAALVLLVLGYLAHEALFRPHTPPVVQVRADSVARAGDGWRVSFTAANGGFATAAAVTVEGEIALGDGSKETSEVTLDYVPGRAERRGGLYFTADPTRHELKLRAHGYDEP